MLVKSVVLIAVLAAAQALDLASLKPKLSEMAASGVPDADVTRHLRLRRPFKPNNRDVQLPAFEGKSEKAKLEVSISVFQSSLTNLEKFLADVRNLRIRRVRVPQLVRRWRLWRGDRRQGRQLVSHTQHSD
jgi:hypothetical protein